MGMTTDRCRLRAAGNDTWLARVLRPKFELAVPDSHANRARSAELLQAFAWTARAWADYADVILCINVTLRQKDARDASIGRRLCCSRSHRMHLETNSATAFRAQSRLLLTHTSHYKLTVNHADNCMAIHTTKPPTPCQLQQLRTHHPCSTHGLAAFYCRTALVRASTPQPLTVPMHSCARRSRQLRPVRHRPQAVPQELMPPPPPRSIRGRACHSRFLARKARSANARGAVAAAQAARAPMRSELLAPTR